MGSVKRLGRGALAWGSVLFAAIIVVAGNFVADAMFGGSRIDLTEDGRFTISEGTRATLTSIDEPIRVRVYFSHLLGERYPPYAQHFDRVKTLLDTYQSIAGGGLIVQYFDPEPFSDAEDRAVADRIRGVPMNTQGELGYFGISATNSVDDRKTLPFLDIDREQFLEYDLTSAIYSLSQYEQPVVGLITGVGIDGSVEPQRVEQPWRVMDQIRQFFDVRALNDIKHIPSRLTWIPDDVDVLFVVQPLGLSEATVYAIDQYALRGGKVVMFLDPSMTIAASIGYDEKLVKLLEHWGIRIARDTVAGDLKTARPLETGNRDDRVFSKYVAYLGLGSDQIVDSDPVAAGIDKLNLLTAGVVEPVEGARTQLTPLFRTSDQSMEYDTERVKGRPDPVGLLRDFKASGVPLTLAARVSGPASSAFPDGPPPPPDVPPAAANEPPSPVVYEAAPDGTRHVNEGTINAIVVADADMLHDQFWVTVREFFGEQLLVPHANNAALVVNSLENLSGASALIGLRGRGIDDRPFEVVENLQVAAEQRYRETERGLAQELDQLEQRINQIEAAAGGSVVLSVEDRAMVENFRQRASDVRRELREVKLALRRDIDNLDRTLRVINIGGIPALFAVVGLAVVGWRRRPRRRGDR